MEKKIISSLKTSLLKWKPDYDSAGDEYNKAGKKQTIAINVHNLITKTFFSYQQWPTETQNN
jgi:hypothetical protein